MASHFVAAAAEATSARLGIQFKASIMISSSSQCGQKGLSDTNDEGVIVSG